MCGHVSHHPGAPALAPDSACLRRAASGIGMAVALLCAHTAQAIDKCELSGDTNTPWIVHVVGTFASDTTYDDFLTDWIHISQPNAWTCTRTLMPATPVAEEVILKAYMPPISPLPSHIFPFGGENYHIFTSGAPNNSRIGFIMTRRYRIQANSGYQWESPWLPARSSNTGGNHPAGYNHMLKIPNNDTYTVSFEYKIRLLKKPYSKSSGNDFPKTDKVIEFEAVEWWFYRANGGHLPTRKTRIRAWFNRTDNTCTTPAYQLVLLDDVPLSTFINNGYIGYTPLVGTTPFTLKLTNCAPTISGIDYKVAPAGFHPNSHNPTVLETKRWHTIPHTGMLANTTGSATGVGIQVLDGNGLPIEFNTAARKTAPGFTQGDTGLDLQLQARYIQTANTVTPGTVYATMTVLYMYK